MLASSAWTCSLVMRGARGEDEAEEGGTTASMEEEVAVRMRMDRSSMQLRT